MYDSINKSKGDIYIAYNTVLYYNVNYSVLRVKKLPIDYSTV